VVGVPKTIDNDLGFTAFTFGFGDAPPVRLTPGSGVLRMRRFDRWKKNVRVAGEHGGASPPRTIQQGRCGLAEVCFRAPVGVGEGVCSQPRVGRRIEPPGLLASCRNRGTNREQQFRGPPQRLRQGPFLRFSQTLYATIEVVGDLNLCFDHHDSRAGALENPS
jgi:hypothetical protein